MNVFYVAVLHAEEVLFSVVRLLIAPCVFH